MELQTPKLPKVDPYLLTMRNFRIITYSLFSYCGFEFFIGLCETMKSRYYAYFFIRIRYNSRFKIQYNYNLCNIIRKNLHTYNLNIIRKDLLTCNRFLLVSVFYPLSFLTLLSCNPFSWSVTQQLEGWTSNIFSRKLVNIES